MLTSQTSSSFLSLNLLHSFMRASLSKLKCLNTISLSSRTLDTATNESPAENSFSPRSTTAFCIVSPWLLCTVMAQVRQTGTCNLEQVPFLPSQVRRIGAIGTTFVLSILLIVGPLKFSNEIRTAIGRKGGPWSSPNRKSCTVPVAPLTNPASVQRLAVNITCAPLASNNCASRPCATSDSAFLASFS